MCGTGSWERSMYSVDVNGAPEIVPKVYKDVYVTNAALEIKGEDKHYSRNNTRMKS